MKLFEYSGNLHMHTRYSDGHAWHEEIAQAAIAAGLDFVMVTDHNVLVKGVERYYENDAGRVLLLTGEEVHDSRRQPQCNHFLAYGVDKELARHAADPQNLIDQTREAGGFGFLAHPFEKALTVFDEQDYSWYDWNIEGFTGLEIWNYMSSFKSAVAHANRQLPIKSKLLASLQAARMAFDPDKYITGPEPETLEKWDELLAQGQRVLAVGNSDAHATPMQLGPIKREIFPYEHCFRAVNTHILTRRELSGDVENDRRAIVQAVGAGNSFVAYDAVRATQGFRFSGKGRGKGIMGDEIKMDVGATLQVLAPAKCRIRLIRHGRVVREEVNQTTLTFLPVDEGAYRVECWLHSRGKERGWIFSNPIFLR